MIHADDGAVARALAETIGSALELTAILFEALLELQLQRRNTVGVSSQGSRMRSHGLQLSAQALGFPLEPHDVAAVRVDVLLEGGVSLGGRAQFDCGALL